MKKVLTIIMDGLGFREDSTGNAVKAANMETINTLWENYPHSLLMASEEPVGLYSGQFGNSETGHLTIGAGRLIKQREVQVDEFLKYDIKDNEQFQSIVNNIDKDIHIMGLASDGNIHAKIDNFITMYELLVKNGAKKIHFHLITDGRDTDVHAAYTYVKMIEDKIKEYKVGDIATVCGRYYAMDRNKNYDRTKLYYDLVTSGIGMNVPKIKDGIKYEYNKDITDEFLDPMIINKNGLIKNGDILIWMNYRADRAKQIIDSFTNESFDKFQVKDNKELLIYSFYEIDDSIKTNVFIGKEDIKNTFGRYISDLGLTQARVAETEKFPHVTYFFDGEYEGKIPRCNQFLIPSPDVATYDMIPKMSAVDVTKKCIECMTEDYDFILLNFANADMVGHTGNYDATVKACMTVDVCVRKLLEKAEENFYKVIILADHGNADIMYDETGKINTNHTLSLVPFIIVDNNVELKKNGDLTMVAPTILEYMDIAIPDEMKNTPLLFK